MINVPMFIENFKKGFDAEYLEDVFTNGNCYHFSLILVGMYDGDIVYDPHESHFSTLIDGKFYDITGEIDKPMDFYYWDEMEDIDYNEYILTSHSCIYKI